MITNFAGRGSHDFFPQQCPAPTLDQAELRIHFIRAVDGDVDVLNFIQRGQRDAQAGGQFLGVNRSGYAANLQSGLHPFAEKTHREGGGRSRSQADDIAIAHEAQAGAGRGFFFLVIRHARPILYRVLGSVTNLPLNS